MDRNQKLRRHESYCQEAILAYKKLDTYMSKLNFDATVPIHFHCLAMATAVRETMYCMLHLRKLDSDNQMFPMLRQMMELSCYLAFIAQDPYSNYEIIALKDFKARLSYLGRVHEEDDDEDMKKDRDELLRIESELKAKHGNVLGFYEIVKAVAPEDFYDEYRFLSPFAHSNLVSLERRYQRHTKGGVEPFKPMSEEDMRHLWILAEHFLDSIIISMDILKKKLSKN